MIHRLPSRGEMARPLRNVGRRSDRPGVTPHACCPGSSAVRAAGLACARAMLVNAVPMQPFAGQFNRAVKFNPD